jgi:hypothetical protein
MNHEATKHPEKGSVPLSIDIEGQSRPWQDNHTDMGAYESDGRDCPP